MKLETSQRTIILEPAAEQIAEELLKLPADSGSFAILSRSEQVYVQVAGPFAEGFILEYRDGSEEKHFQAVGGHVPPSVALDVFQRFAAGDPTWKDRVNWEPWQTGSALSGKMGPVAVAVVVLMILLVALTGFLNLGFG